MLDQLSRRGAPNIMMYSCLKPRANGADGKALESRTGHPVYTTAVPCTCAGEQGEKMRWKRQVMCVSKRIAFKNYKQ